MFSKMVLTGVVVVFMCGKVWGSDNSTVVTNIVNKYLKGMQNGQCSSLYDLALNYHHGLYFIKNTKPKALWPQLILERKSSWSDECKTKYEEVSNKNLGDYSLYITPKTKWRIIEKRHLGRNFYEVFVKFQYSADEAAYSDEVGRLFRRKSAGHSDEVGHPLRGCAAG